MSRNQEKVENTINPWIEFNLGQDGDNSFKCFGGVAYLVNDTESSYRADPNNPRNVTKAKLAVCYLLFIMISFLLGPIFFPIFTLFSKSLIEQIPINKTAQEIQSGGNMSTLTFTPFGYSVPEHIDSLVRFTDEQLEVVSDRAFETSFFLAVASHVFFLIQLIFVLYSANFWVKIGAKKTLALVLLCIFFFATYLSLLSLMELTKSELCGSSYIELPFERDYDMNCSCYKDRGTIAIIHDDIPSTCILGTDGIVLLSLSIATLAWVVTEFVLTFRS